MLGFFLNDNHGHNERKVIHRTANSIIMDEQEDWLQKKLKKETVTRSLIIVLVLGEQRVEVGPVGALPSDG
jgi:hypothetical protein